VESRGRALLRYKENNHDLIREYVRQRYVTNHDRICELQRLRYAANRENERDRKRRYREANPEAEVEQRRRYRAAHRDQILENHRIAYMDEMAAVLWWREHIGPARREDAARIMAALREMEHGDA
jgi:hypothetical protein